MKKSKIIWEGDFIKQEGCAKCHKHRATQNWVGEGGIMDYVHGNYQLWCKCCCLKA